MNEEAFIKEPVENRAEVFPGIRLFYHGMPIAAPLNQAESLWIMDYCHKGQCTFSERENPMTVQLSCGGLFLCRLSKYISTERTYAPSYEGFSLLFCLSDMRQAIARSQILFRGYALSVEVITSQIEAMAGSAFYPSEKDLPVFEDLYGCKRGMAPGDIHLFVLRVLFYLNNGQIAERTDACSPKHLSTIREVAAFLSSCPEVQLSQAQLARQFLLSLSELKRAFRICYHMPVAAYQRQERIKKACRLLRETDLPVAEIALQVGYKSHSQFTAAFRRQMEITPSGYRQHKVHCSFD